MPPPTVDNGAGAKVKPKTDVVIQSLTVGEPDAERAGRSPRPRRPGSGAVGRPEREQQQVLTMAGEQVTPQTKQPR